VAETTTAKRPVPLNTWVTLIGRADKTVGAVPSPQSIVQRVIRSVPGSVAVAERY
jgi:hypothetical protein